jgi:hypothetical protein
LFAHLVCRFWDQKLILKAANKKGEAMINGDAHWREAVENIIGLIATWILFLGLLWIKHHGG